MNNKLISTCRKACRYEYAEPKKTNTIRDETLGSRKANPGYSCLDILKNGPVIPKNGLYWIENPNDNVKPF